MVTSAKKKTTSMDKKKSSQVTSKNDSQTKSTLKVAKTSLKSVSKELQTREKKKTFEMGTKKGSCKPSSMGKPSSFQGRSTGFSVSKCTLASSKTSSTGIFATAKSKIAAPSSKTALKDKIQQKNPQNIPLKPVTHTIT